MTTSRATGYSSALPWLFAIFCGLCFLPGARAFGAGNIPSFSYLEGKAFRHGDIEDVLAELVKKSGGFLGRGSKFGGLDISRIYFGNWLRDYSQAMDIAGLSKIPKQTILNLVMGLGFLAHGYATAEFEVTDERLGVYLPTEHLDNPKGYAADQPGGDARKFDARLRPPIDPRELEIDPRSGLKNYLANENGGWDTSTRLVKERINQCIDLGRRARSNHSEADLYEAYRLLGSLLHSVEDFAAHSNWCELSLKRLGYSQVFCHVGDAVIVHSPAGPCPPLVTGTFGGADFMHSMLGEATDHISSASVSDLQKAMDDSKGGSGERGIGGGSAAGDALRKLFFELPGGTGNDFSREMGDIENIRDRAASGQSASLSPQELHATLWKVLTFRDNVVKGIAATIEKIPGLSSFVEKLTDSINKFVFTTLEPLLKPVMSSATQALMQGSAQVVNNEDQFEVFNDPHASDPTHSFLSKDHFALILNEPAGEVAKIIVRHTVDLIVKAWDDTSIDSRAVGLEVVKGVFHHPYFYDDSSKIQRDMGAYLKSWIDGQSAEDKRYILNALTKESVREHKNKRKGHENDNSGHSCGATPNAFINPQRIESFATQHIPGAAGAFGTYHQVQSAYGNVQHQAGAAQQYFNRDIDSNPQTNYDQANFSQPARTSFEQQPNYGQQSSYGQSDYQQPVQHHQPQHHQPQYQQPQSHFPDHQQHQMHAQQGYAQSGYDQGQGGYNQPAQGQQYGHQQPPHHQQYGSNDYNQNQGGYNSGYSHQQQGSGNNYY